MIAIEGLTKTHGDRRILDGVSACFEAGEVVSVIGASGSGKTTLLRCLNGLEPFDAGLVRVGGAVLHPGHGRHHREELRAIRARVGFVFQTWNLFANRTALGNVAEGPIHVKKEPRQSAIERARALLARMGLSHREGAYPRELSGGEQQRVAIARALAMEPEALLLDEPTSALDPQRVGELVELLRGICNGKLTLVIATHEMAFARAVSTRVAVLHEGRIIEDGAPERVLERPEHERTRALIGLKEGA